MYAYCSLFARFLQLSLFFVCRADCASIVHAAKVVLFYMFCVFMQGGSGCFSSWSTNVVFSSVYEVGQSRTILDQNVQTNRPSFALHGDEVVTQSLGLLSIEVNFFVNIVEML